MTRVTSRLCRTLVLACAAVGPVPAAAQGGGWTFTGSMADGRYFHTATELCSGKVLVTGRAVHGAPKTAETYDPATGTWSDAGPMNFDHRGGTATLIPAGCGSPSCRVLVTGGLFDPATNKVETYVEDTGEWRIEPPMAFPREGHTAVPIEDGCRVLVTGGRSQPEVVRREAEIFDARAGAWASTGDMNHRRINHAAGPLPGGWVLVAGGQGQPHAHDTAEVWNPATGQWVETAPPNGKRWMHSGCALDDGRFLVAGGQFQGAVLKTAEVYDPFSGTWGPLPDMATARRHFACTTLIDGRALVTGGFSPYGNPPISPLTEIYDPVTNAWVPGPTMNEGRYAHTCTLLSRGCAGSCQPCPVLAAGGYDKQASYRTAETATP